MPPKPGSGWHRQNRDSPAAKQRRAEYNSPEYKARRAADAKIVAAGHAYCWRCSKWLPPGQPWHEGHSDDWTRLLGPECPPCNLTAASRKGNRIANTRRSHTRTAPAWRSRAW